MTSTTPYAPRRPSRSFFVPVRGLNYHLHCWGDPSLVTAEQPALFMLHGWMDVGASFQFLVDAMTESGLPDRFIVAPDWRGFGLTRAHAAAAADTYWFPDYLADLDVLLKAAFDGADSSGLAVDLLGHSMGGNAAMLYAGIRPERIRRLMNLEGFGMPDSNPADAPGRYRRWLDELAQPAELQTYDSLASVSRRLQRNNPLLKPERAMWLAQHWSSEIIPGVWELRADPAHKHINPILYRKEEVLSVWKKITAPMLWIEGDLTDTKKLWGNRYTREEFSERLGQVARVERHVVSPAGHMVHHDRPEQIAALLTTFL
jgi:pimeloyl-ACP methyl ester carboxylesterase